MMVTDGPADFDRTGPDSPDGFAAVDGTDPHLADDRNDDLDDHDGLADDVDVDDVGVDDVGVDDVDGLPPVPRRWLAPDQGESLLLNRHAIEIVTRMYDFSAFTGIAADQLTCSPLTAVPIPIADDPDQPPPGRWPGLTPEALWHPLLWLPARIAQPADGQPVSEWMVQVCYELEVCGLYDPDDGWVDVLATAGLTIDDPDVGDRVADWAAGGRDPLLDDIDLSDFFDPGGQDPGWSARAAAESLPVLQEAAVVVTADDLASVCDALADTADDGADGADADESRQALDTVLLLADGHLPQPGPAAVSAPSLNGFYTDPAQWPTWQTLRDQLADSDTSPWQVGSQAGAGLAVLKQAYWPAIEQLQHQTAPD